jgi:hypothetical protein
VIRVGARNQSGGIANKELDGIRGIGEMERTANNGNVGVLDCEVVAWGIDRKDTIEAVMGRMEINSDGLGNCGEAAGIDVVVRIITKKTVPGGGTIDNKKEQTDVRHLNKSHQFFV